MLEFTRCPVDCVIDKEAEQAEAIRSRAVNVDERKKSWPDYLDDFADIFSEKGYEELPAH